MFPSLSEEEPEEDDEDPEEDPADYPTDRDDDDDDDEDEDEEEEEEHPALADSVPPRVRFASPTPSHEVGESSAAGAARQEMGPAVAKEDPYFVARGDLYGIRPSETTIMYGIMEDARDDRSQLRGRVNLLYRDRPVHYVMSLRTTVVAQSTLILELQSADHRRQMVISELLASDHKRQVGVTTIIAKFLILDMPIDRGTPILTSLDTAESDSDDEEQYAFQRNKFRAPIYGPKPVRYLNCSYPLDQSLALQELMNPFRLICVWKKVVSFLGSLPVALQHVKWKPDYTGCFNKKEDSDGQWHAEIKLTDSYGNIYDQGFITKKTTRKLAKYHKLSNIMSPNWFHNRYTSTTFGINE
ncbi:hypothetical protein Tco_0084678 [Tanacetum coccineum]